MSRLFFAFCGLAVVILLGIKMYYSILAAPLSPAPGGQPLVNRPAPGIQIGPDPSMGNKVSDAVLHEPTQGDVTAAESMPLDARLRELQAYDINPVRGNALLNELLAEHPPGLEAVLIGISRDLAHSERWHNFVIQHLANSYEAHQTRAVREILEWAAIHGNESQREVAVFSLARIAESLALPQADPLVRALHQRMDEILSGKEADNVIDAAFRAGALLDDSRYVAAAIRVIGSAESSAQIRVSALDYIAQVRPAHALGALERLIAMRPADSSGQIDVAVRRAVAAIKRSD